VVCRDLGVPFILNDRPDLALASGADGVHVGQDDTPPAVARRILGPSAIVGLSTHAPAQWEAAAGEPVDYLSAGPVNPTPTKPGRQGTGLQYLVDVASTAAGGPGGIPWFVTGGVTPDTIPSMAAAGARRFVVVRYLTESDDPQGAASRLRSTIDESIATLGG
jgi:thiamine-phosphate pyrophosphorylase